MRALLDRLRGVADLRLLSPEEKIILCSELRQNDTTIPPGFAEVALVLFDIFDAEDDRVAWGDATIARAASLLPGATVRYEPHAVGTALGWAQARKLRRKRYAIAAVQPITSIPVHSLPSDIDMVVIGLDWTGGMRAAERIHKSDWEYSSPIAGHDYNALRRAVSQAREAGGRQLVHVQVDARRPAPPPLITSLSNPIPSWLEVAAHTVTELGRQDLGFMWVTRYQSQYIDTFPERSVVVGDPPEYRVAVAVGLAEKGIPTLVDLPAAAVPQCAPLLLRAAAENYPLAVLVEEEGGGLHTASLRVIPHLNLLSPADENDLVEMLSHSLAQAHPSVILCPSGEAVGVPLKQVTVPGDDVTFGAEVVLEGWVVAVLAHGRAVFPALLAAQMLLAGYGVQIAVVNMRTIRPIDADALSRLVAQGVQRFLTVEEGHLVGGMGPAVMEALHHQGLDGIPVRALGQEDAPLATGPLGPHDPEAIVRGVLGMLGDLCLLKQAPPVAETPSTESVVAPFELPGAILAQKPARTVVAPQAVAPTVVAAPTAVIRKPNKKGKKSNKPDRTAVLRKPESLQGDLPLDS